MKVFWKYPIFWIEIVLTVLTVLVVSYRYQIFAQLGIIFAIPIYAFPAGFAVSTGYSVFHFASHFRQQKWKAFIPIMIGIAGIILVVITFQVTQIKTNYFDWNFEYYHDKRMEIIEAVEAGKIEPKSELGYIDLPMKYWGTAREGRVSVRKRNGVGCLYFYTDILILGNSRGFAYFSESLEAENFISLELIKQKDYGNGWWLCKTE